MSSEANLQEKREVLCGGEEGGNGGRQGNNTPISVDDEGGNGGGPEDGVGDACVGEKMERAIVEVPQDEQYVDATMSLMSRTSNQLTLLFQGEVYVFDSVSPEKVQAVLLLLGGCELPTVMDNMALQCHPDHRGLDDILRRPNIPAKRVASLIRFREKRKERCYDKKIRYTVRKEVALSGGKDNLQGRQILRMGQQPLPVLIPLRAQAKMMLLEKPNVKTVALVKRPHQQCAVAQLGLGPCAMHVD